MNWSDFDAVFNRFRTSAFRLEVLDRYADDEDEEFQLFLAGEALPERSAATVPWLRRVAETTAAGKSWQRVHIVSRPYSDYLRFELVGYEGNLDAGEDVRLADRDEYSELADLRSDFWLFDADGLAPFAMLMDLDEVGHLRNFEVTEDLWTITRCVRERDLALSLSHPLERSPQEA